MLKLVQVLMIAAAIAAPVAAPAQTTTPAPIIKPATPPAKTTAPAPAATTTAPATTPPAATTTTTPAAAQPAKPAAATLLDINSASATDLDKLWGIGAVRAQAIIANRPYKGKDDLINRKIIPQNVYDKIKDQIIARQK